MNSENKMIERVKIFNEIVFCDIFNTFRASRFRGTEIYERENPSSSSREEIQLEVIKSRRRAARCRSGRSGKWMNERVSFEIKRKSPPAPPFSSLHQSQLYPLSPLLSFIITARDFIPALEAAGRPARCSARKKEEEGRRWSEFRERDAESNRLLAQRLL